MIIDGKLVSIGRRYLSLIVKMMRARTQVSPKKKALATLSAGDHIIDSAGFPPPTKDSLLSLLEQILTFSLGFFFQIAINHVILFNGVGH